MLKRLPGGPSQIAGAPDQLPRPPTVRPTGQLPRPDYRQVFRSLSPLFRDKYRGRTHSPFWSKAEGEFIGFWTARSLAWRNELPVSPA